ncbi:M10 family metallopeptidase [Pararhizobium qamdonense]|uniref:M10 family metallopeptidase n=1 Tax=Pararhizobium qamdonense TaxID=3031126 RepID=UPI0023E09F30|nr:M10 family metallopeptidase [Pararhizobium qamdonense]
MTGTNKTVKTIAATGNQLVDGIISGTAWGGDSVTYAFPTLASQYHYGNPAELNNNFGAVSAAQKNAALFIMEQSSGTAANDGFSVEGFTKLAFSAGSATTATLRFAQSDEASPTAYAYFPDTHYSAGDTWFSTDYEGTINDYRAPVAGNYAWHTLVHELGHALGLKHGHDTGVFGATPDAFNSVEYTVMTYNGFVGDNANGYAYEQFGAPQTFMMADIAALQHMYGANYTTNSGNTVYKWTPDSGKTYVDGKVAIDPGGNRIFATIWDGGGKDTFDLTAYKSNLNIDLRAGGFSMFSEDQLAGLGGGPNDGYARGNIFNALLHKGNLASLIEDVKAGSGNDRVVGNQAANALFGNGGNDSLFGKDGNDSLFGGAGGDKLNGGKGRDMLTGGGGADMFIFSELSDSTPAASGRDTILDFRGSEGDRINLAGIDADITKEGNQGFKFIGTKGFGGDEGELRYVKNASGTYIYGDVDGDRKADFSIHLEDAVTLQKGYFFL